MATTPPGWYDDGRGALRWWDGLQWTEHVQTPDPVVVPDAEQPQEEPAIDLAADPAVVLDAEPTTAAVETEPVAEPDVSTEPDAAAESEATIAPEPAAPEAVEEPVIEPAPVVAPAAPSEPAVGYAGAYAPADPAAAYAPSTPPGYPGGFPGGPSPSGGFIAATESKKSKLWILWVVLGVVLLGIVILASVLIPILIGLFGRGVPSVAANGDDQKQAVAAVQLYDSAWQSADCDKFFAATTEGFRASIQLTECDAFVDASKAFGESVQDYTVTVTSIESEGEQITVQTSESYRSLYGEDGTLLDQPEPLADQYVYTVIAGDNDWVIDGLEAE